MPESYADAESVTSTDVSVAVDPALLNKPVRPEDSASSGEDLLKHKLGLANQHAKKFKSLADEYQKKLELSEQRISALEEAQQSAVRESLEGQGAYKELYEGRDREYKELHATYLNETSALKQQLESVTQSAEQERLKANALQQITQANAVNPNQLFQLLQSQIRVGDEGTVVALNSGVEQPLGDYLANLKSAGEWQHHFSASGAKGMGSTPGAASVAPGMTNPYRTRNLTEAMKLEASNPQLAQQLKAEAQKGS